MPSTPTRRRWPPTPWPRITSQAGARPDLVVDKRGPDTLAPGAVGTYALTVANLKQASGPTPATVRDVLPPGMSFVGYSIRPIASSDTFARSADGQVVTCTGAKSGDGGQVEIDVAVRAPSTPTVVTDAATIDPDNAVVESDETNNTSQTVTTDVAEMTDTTPPAVTPSVNGPQGQGGWYVGDVSLAWTVADPESEVTSTSGCDPATVTTDTAATTFTCQATSTGGTSSAPVTVRDATPPAIGHTVTPPSPDGAGGWYVTAPTVTFGCSDPAPGSGLAACAADGASGPARTLGESTAARTVTGTAADGAGRTAADGAPASRSTCPTRSSPSAGRRPPSWPARATRGARRRSPTRFPAPPYRR